MKKQSWKKAWLLVICICILSSVTYRIWMKKKTFTVFASNPEHEKKLKKFKEIVNVLNEDYQNCSLSYTIFIANELYEAAKMISHEELLHEICKEDHADITKILLIQMNGLLHEGRGAKELLHFLKDEHSFEIKRNVLINLQKNQAVDGELFKEVILGQDERLAFAALKILNIEMPHLSYEIADGILENFDGSMNDRIRAAIQTKAKQLKFKSHRMKLEATDEKEDFIALCDSILQNSKDQVNTDTVVFALSDMMTAECISYIVQSNWIEAELKEFCIDQNCTILKQMIERSNHPKDLEIVTQAMKIYPMIDMIKPLENLKKLEIFLSYDQNDMEETIDFIKMNGVKANVKFEEEMNGD